MSSLGRKFIVAEEFGGFRHDILLGLMRANKGA